MYLYTPEQARRIAMLICVAVLVLGGVFAVVSLTSAEPKTASAKSILAALDTKLRSASSSQQQKLLAQAGCQYFGELINTADTAADSLQLINTINGLGVRYNQRFAPDTLTSTGFINFKPLFGVMRPHCQKTVDVALHGRMG
jgi:hypothetical protein